MARALILAAALALGACIHGPRLDRVSFARQPVGAQTSVATPRGSYTGELITASDTGFVVLVSSGNRLVFVPMAGVRHINVESLGQHRAPIRGTALRKIRLVSRHPYGIPAEARTALLSVTGQSDIERPEQ